MDTDTRKNILRAHGLSDTLLAVDPYNCGCTECLIGEYIPENQIPRDQLSLFKSLVRQGVLGDHTYGEKFGQEYGVGSYADQIRTIADLLAQCDGEDVIREYANDLHQIADSL